MNIAFPALLLFLLVLPGIALRYTYLKGFWRWNSPVSIQSISDEVAYSLVWAAILHVVWCSTVSVLGFGKPDLRSVLVLLIGGGAGRSEELQSAITATVASPFRVVGYFLSILLFSGLLGLIAHISVRKWRLDRKTKALRFKNEWHYLLSGEVLEFSEFQPYERQGIVDGVYLSAIVKHGKNDVLYRGIVADWLLDSKGDLDRILLRRAHRRNLENDRAPGQARNNEDPAYQDDPRYYDIEGNFFVIRYQELTTINIEYVFVDEESPANEDTNLNPQSA
jgi:hypothetical protein